jgi:hypothetical protein
MIEISNETINRQVMDLYMQLIMPTQNYFLNMGYFFFTYVPLIASKYYLNLKYLTKQK